MPSVPGRYSMRIKSLSIIVCAAIVGLFILISYVTSELVVVRGVDAIEGNTASEKMRQLRNHIHAQQVQMGHVAVDWACWDDAYRYMQSPDPEFVKTNMRQQMLAKLNLSSIAYYSRDAVHAAFIEDATENWEPGQSAEAQRLFALLTRKLMRSADEGMTGILMIGGMPYIMAAQKIRDTAMLLPPNGVVFMTRAMDAGFIKDVEHDTLLRFSILPVDVFNNVPAAADDETAFKTVREDGAVNSYSVMRDMFDCAAFCLRLVTDREIAQFGKRMFMQNFILIVITGMGMLVAFLYFTERQILRRILSMQRQAQHIEKSSKPLKKIEIEGDDEIFDLSLKINSMIDALQSNEKFLQQTLDTLQAGVITIEPGSLKIRTINAFAQRFIGMLAEEVVGKPCYEVICPRGVDLCPMVNGHSKAELIAGKLVSADGTQKTIVKSVRAIQLNGEEIYLESFVDITDLETTRQELQRSEERYKTLFMNTGTATAVISSTGLIFLTNTEFSKLVGIPSEEIEGQLFISRFLGKNLFGPQQLFAADSPQTREKYETELTAHNGKTASVLVTLARIPDSGLSVISLLDISERSAMEKELAYRANHDLLTGLANKSLAEEKLLSALREASSGGMVGVLLIDLDRFKQVNDSFGHSLGDKLLRQAAERLTYLARPEDCVARTGGDEFVIVAGRVRSKDQIEALAKNVLCSLNRCFYVDEYSIYLSASIGIACFPENGGTMEALLQSADLAMYTAKAKGKNTYAFFTEDLTVAANDRMALETEMFRAMDSAAFDVYYQPKVNIAHRTLAGCEALVRWKRADGSWISPAVFIPLAEETGLVQRLDMYVLRRACRQQREWEQQGLGSVRVAVNMSGRSIIAESFVDDVLDVLAREDVLPEHIGIEITETAFMSNMAAASRAIAALSEHGIKIYLDDFGTGYSSLYYLHTLPIASLKIDKSFIDGINAPDNASNELVKTVLTLASGLGMATVAEGVETREQAEFLAENGCKVIQGYLFSPAISGSAFAEYLKESQQRISASLT